MTLQMTYCSNQMSTGDPRDIYGNICSWSNNSNAGDINNTGIISSSDTTIYTGDPIDQSGSGIITSDPNIQITPYDPQQQIYPYDQYTQQYPQPQPIDEQMLAQMVERVLIERMKQDKDKGARKPKFSLHASQCLPEMPRFPAGGTRKDSMKVAGRQEKDNLNSNGYRGNPAEGKKTMGAGRGRGTYPLLPADPSSIIYLPYSR